MYGGSKYGQDERGLGGRSGGAKSYSKGTRALNNKRGKDRGKKGGNSGRSAATIQIIKRVKTSILQTRRRARKRKKEEGYRGKKGGKRSGEEDFAMSKKYQALGEDVVERQGDWVIKVNAYPKTEGKIGLN